MPRERLVLQLHLFNGVVTPPQVEAESWISRWLGGAGPIVRHPGSIIRVTATIRCRCCAPRSSQQFAVAPRVRAAIEEMAPQLARISAERAAGKLDRKLLVVRIGRVST